MNTPRRAVFGGAGIAAVALGSAVLARAAPAFAAGAQADLLPSDGRHMSTLAETLAHAPRRRDFKKVPMILTAPDQWDSAALDAVIAYAPAPKQVWDNTDIASPWLNLMRNSLNAQIWAFKHPDFLAVSATHGTAHLALFDQAMWDKYGLAKIAGPKFSKNTLILEKPAAKANAADYEDASGVFSPEDNSIPALQRRGVVFLACHNAIWEQTGKLLANGANPDKLSHEALAAEMTNHLIPGAILTPGIVGTLPELQAASFSYAK
jgi:hypothetical protein